MRTAFSGALLTVLVSCIPPRNPSPLEDAFRKLLSEKNEEYEEGFRTFLNAGSAAASGLRVALTAASGRGFPAVAILYVAGNGDDVPLDLRARHLARFEWPRGQEDENAIVRPYVRDEIERDLVRAGRPALRLLGEALAQDAPSEVKALEVVRVMLRIGGRAAVEEFAGLLEEERDLGGVRVCDIAAGALLYLGGQETLLRTVSRPRLVSSAREWWGRAKEEAESEWTRQAVAAIMDREVLELFTGERIDDLGEWRAKNPSWRPPAPPLHPESLLAKLTASRATAFAANRAMEEATGVRLFVPRADRLGELCAAIRLWQPPPDLEVAWRRYLGSQTLRLTIAVVGHPPKKESNHLLWHYEQNSNSIEEPSGKLEFSSGGEAYLLYVQSRELGTRVIYGEYHEAESGHRTVLREFATRRPAIVFSPSFKACIVISVDEVPGRRTPRPPDELFAETHRRLRKLAESSVGQERRQALLALGYCQNAVDLEFLRQEKAYDALLLLGDPAGLEKGIHLEPYEIEMGLRKASDPRVRSFLEGLRGPS